jgi:hypothetical protein
VQSTVTDPSLFGNTDDYSDGDYIHSSADPADERRELEEDLVLKGQRLPGLEVMPGLRSHQAGIWVGDALNVSGRNRWPLIASGLFFQKMLSRSS